MLFKTFSAAVFGIDAYLVETEVDVVPAFEGHFTVVGLPDIAVKESRERIRAALRNCGFDFPSSHAVTINSLLKKASESAIASDARKSSSPKANKKRDPMLHRSSK
jgi:Subunit ChlI of Mg-chelatase